MSLPEVTVQSILVDWNFHNLDQRILTLMNFKLPGDGRVVLTGLPAALSQNLRTDAEIRTDNHTVLQMVGNTRGYHQDTEGFDLFDFVPDPRSAGMPVGDFKGVSGGGAWVVGADGELDSRMLYGVAFYQNEISTDGGYLTCHGPLSIYLKLRTKIIDGVYSFRQ